MIVAVASGKGGTGKTTVSAALVSVWEAPVIATDLDVEEPNLHLFLRPEISETIKAFLEVPVADETRCTYCAQCADLCQFKAISVLGETLVTFPEMCHGCGGCLSICPEGALSAGTRELGEISWGRADGAAFLMGRLRVGEAMSPPLMRAVKGKLNEMIAEKSADVIIDAPPGVSCPAVNAVMDADVILLVTEPTPFGLYDLKLAHKAFQPLGKPMGAVINRAGLGSTSVYDYCSESGVDIIAEIPYDPDIAKAYAGGNVITEVSDNLQTLIRNLATRVRSMAKNTAKNNVREALHD
ncbi:MAG: ATP-binding protein [Deltaproteobacteria bacterium]|nr:ATP-binding protein [Deltaproteobacteria bacterium]